MQAQAGQFEARQLERDAPYEVRLSWARTVDGGVRYTSVYNGGSCGSGPPFAFQVLDLQITRTQSSAIAFRTAFLYLRPSPSGLEERLHRQRDSLHARAICNRHEQRVPPGLRITFTITVERRLGQERAHSRIDGTQVDSVEVYTMTCMIRLEIVGHVTFSLELGLVAKHFGMRSRLSSIFFGNQF